MKELRASTNIRVQRPDSTIEEAKRTILQCIEALVLVAAAQRDKHAQNVLLAQAASLNSLEERISLHQLPEVFVRSLVNDIRLDTLMVLADLKVLLTFRKQELCAPTEKLRFEAHERRTTSGGDEADEGPVQSEEETSRIVSDLRVLVDVEQSLRHCVL